jgi:hypothetical protein
MHKPPVRHVSLLSTGFVHPESSDTAGAVQRRASSHLRASVRLVANQTFVASLVMRGHAVRAMIDPDRLSRHPTWLLRAAEGRLGGTVARGVNQSPMSTGHESVIVFVSPPPHLCFSLSRLPSTLSSLRCPFLPAALLFAFRPAKQLPRAKDEDKRRLLCMSIVCCVFSFLPSPRCFVSLFRRCAVGLRCALVGPSPCPLPFPAVPLKRQRQGSGSSATHTWKKNTDTDSAVLLFPCAHCPLLPSLGCPAPLRCRCLCSLVRLSPLPLPPLPRRLRARAHTIRRVEGERTTQLATRRAFVLQFRARAGWLVSRGRPGRKLLRCSSSSSRNCRAQWFR